MIENLMIRIKQIASEYDFKSVLRSIHEIESANKISLGLVGAFNTKRSVLVKSLWGVEFPDDTKLCDKVYRIEQGSPEQGSKVLYAEDESIPNLSVAKVKDSVLLEKSTLYVLPGLNRDDETDSQVRGQLPNIDFLCYVFSRNMSEADFEFLSSSIVAAEPNCVDFVFLRDTKADGDSWKSVVEDIKSNIAGMPHFSMIDISDRFHEVSPSDDASVKRFESALAERIKSADREILKAREGRSVEKVMKLLRSAINNRISALSKCPEDAFEEKQKNYERIEALLQEDLAIRQQFYAVGKRIGNRVKQAFSEMKWNFMGASSQEERANVIGEFLSKTIGEIVKQEYTNAFGEIEDQYLDATVDRTDVLKAINDLNMKAKRATQIADFFNVVGTAALMTLGPATGGGNLYEGLAGAFLGSQTEEHIFGSLRKFNPVVMATDFAADLYREHSFDSYEKKMESMGAAIAAKTYAIVEELYIRPRRLEIEAKNEEIARIDDSRAQKMIDNSDELRRLSAICDELEDLS